MNIQLTNYNEHLVFETQTGCLLLVRETNNHTSVDTIYPMELMPVRLVSYKSIEIVKILNRQKIVDFYYNISVDTVCKEEIIPVIFKESTINYSFSGEFNKTKITEQTATINYKITLNNEEI